MYNLPLWSEEDNPQYHPTTSPEKLPYHKEYYRKNKEQLTQRRQAYRQANQEHVVQYQRAYYAANKEHRDRESREYQKAHKEQIRQQRKASYQANKERIAQRRKIYTEANKEKIAQRNKAYREAHKERLSQRNSAKHQRNKEAFSQIKAQNPSIGGYQSASRLKHKYDITLFEWYMLLEYQEYKCAVCGGPLNFRSSSRRIAVDHNHSTGQVRGLVHHGCNMMVGLAENPDRFQPARSYIEKNGVYGQFQSFLSRLEGNSQ